MRRTTTALTLAGLMAGSAWAFAVAANAAPVAHAARSATVKLAHTSAGTILVTGSGFTLYEFTADKRNRDHCMKVSGCTSVWPPLTVSGHPTAGSGVRRSLLGTISIGHGHHQVTYAGHPLYRYTGDSTRGDTSYIGANEFGGFWYGLTAKGHAVH